MEDWPKERINKSKLRLLDSNFSWAKVIMESIPLTKEYADKKLDRNEVKRIIR